MGCGYVQNTQILFRAKIIPRKHHLWFFLAITIAARQGRVLLILIPLHNEHNGMGICAKNTQILFTKEITSRKHQFWSFLATTIAARQG